MVEVDLSQPPFTFLDDEGRERIRSGVDLAYFDRDEIILEMGQPGEFVFIIHKGEVAELDTTLPGARERIGHYTQGDLFGAISILNGKSRYRFRAEQESLCYLLPKALFLQLCDDYPAFAEFFRQTLSHKARLLTEQRAEGGVTMAGFMLAKVSECMRKPLCVAPDATIAEAVNTLNEGHADSLLVDGEQGVGMITKTDLLNALVLEERDKHSPVVDIAHFELITVGADQYLFEALVVMTRFKVERVVVMEGDKPSGVVELTDVLSFFSSRSYVVSLQVEQADTLEALMRASHRTPELVKALMAQGVKLRFAMGLLAALNGRIMAKAWGFLIDERYHRDACLMVMGSEGRGEQILKTDQDNGLILTDDLEWPDLDERMQALTRTLIDLGYPPCPGNIMVSNPEWVGTESQWRERIARWVQARDGDSLMKLAIMLDSHAVAGNPALLDRLREGLFEQCSRDELLLSYFARAALRFSTPLTLFGSLKKPQHGIDIKKGGIFPIVHGVRTMALERRIKPTSTLERLEALAEDGRLDERTAENLGEALSLFTELRLKQQLERLDRDDDGTSPDRVVVQQLSSLERDLLREALHIVKDFKQHLSQRYHLEYS
ncbi:cyclic nucleotide-binding/CBS domain-containing protein [Halomonas campisalis]|uniref:Cyclic nucleotide-binding/CBS domain-containing protein n=1 Tax=Billgrantia campisalis TaxID=74661 RepID=A0ABS9P786_9GAMM|nr:putative nucleotidyltransferase substrate binding domain-containing protein [Halomonas campisalis]MCG6657649.1 cyclic nucleotide-binding/CBS domain-containing protein [Halomonas campisalis]MDR5862579.1 putative nucleotidyltransferase substrate binding domain-containing protein [Halomonas campisalis]